MNILDIVALLSPFGIILSAVLTYLVMSSKNRTERQIAENKYLLELERLQMEKDNLGYEALREDNKILWAKVRELNDKVDELYKENGVLRQQLASAGLVPESWKAE